MKTKSLPILLVCAFMLAFVTCKKEPDPNIQSFELTKEELAIGTTSATIEGTYSYAGVIDGIKVCLKENSADKGEFDVELDGNDFSVTMPGLKPATEYQYHYVVDYGFSKPFITETKTFTTTSEAPTVKILEVRASEDSTSFRIVCKVEDDGGSAVISRGICWSIKYDHPTMNDDTISDTNGGSGEYYIDLGPEVLSSSTKHYVRAFARNARGLGLSEPVDFRTPGETTKPEVTTVEVSEVTYNSAYCLCNVRSDGGLDLRKRGVCYGESATPGVTINIDAAEATLGEYGIRLTGLEPNKDYHVHAFATNDEGTSDGEDITFHTTDGRPTVTTLGITEITETTASGGGNVTDQGYSPVTERGICWSTHSEPEISDYTYPNGTGEGSYTGYMTDLTPDQTYYVRAYARNAQGLSYGEEVSFTATDGLPEVWTLDVTDITATSAKAHGEVTDEGASPVTERGICWSATNPIPTIADEHGDIGTGLGTYEVNLTNLTPGTTYYVRAYAKNNQSDEPVYGTSKSFDTEATCPTVETVGIDGTTVSGNVTDDGGASITERGVCWSTNDDPTLHYAPYPTAGTGPYSVELTDLEPGKTYKVKAYARNSVCPAYGEELTLTMEADLPTVQTLEVSNLGQNSAMGNGNVTNDGGAAITERGVCWSTSPMPDLNDSHAVSEETPDIGTFTAMMNGLIPNTHYYVRAYAKNSAGKIGYGNQTDFTTAQSISAPTVTTTSPVTNITQTTATGGGNVTNDGGSPVTERGICWSTSHNPTISGSHSSNGTGTGVYQVNMTGLTPGTTYYVRAYAKNDANLIGYGTEVQFTTQQQTTYTITVSANPSNGGTVTGGGTYNQGASCTVTATAAADYRFIRWEENGSQVSQNSSYQFTVNGNRTLVAQFITKPTVTTSQVTNITQTTATGGGNVTNSGGATVTERGICWSTSQNPSLTNGSHQQASSGGTGSFTVPMTGLTPGTHYYVRAYATNSEGTRYGGQVEFDTQAQQYTITVSANPSNGGTVSGGGTYNQGASCTVHAQAATNYQFTNWTEGGTVVSTQANYTFTVNGNRTLVANFTRQYTIAVSANPTNGGTVSGGGTYNQGASCTVHAQAATNYQFTNWTEGGTVVSTQANYTFTVNGNRTLVANFNYNGGGNVPTGAIDGKFTINANGEKVYFSKGNLQYIGSASTPYWKFADNQWDVLGTTTGQNSTSQNVDRDLFGWGTSGYHDSNDPYNVNYQPWSTSSDTINETYNCYGYGPSTNMPSPNLTESSANYDWGVNNIIYSGSIATSGWRTLTGMPYGEWDYVFNKRTTTTGIHYARAQITGTSSGTVNGVILFPDDWSTSIYNPINYDQPEANYSSNPISVSQWNAMENAGAVFLPTAGSRIGSSVMEVGIRGYYWSASFSSSSGSGHVYFDNYGNLHVIHGSSRYGGSSIRLVLPVEN